MIAYMFYEGRKPIFDTLRKTKRECRRDLCILYAEELKAGYGKIKKVKISPAKP
jgi:hypothetical protein